MKAIRSSRVKGVPFFQPCDLSGEFPNFGIQLRPLLFMSGLQLCCPVTLFKQTWETFYCSCSPLLSLGGMNFVFSRTLCERFLFFEKFLHHFGLKSGCVLFSHHILSISYVGLLPCSVF